MKSMKLRLVFELVMCSCLGIAITAHAEETPDTEILSPPPGFAELTDAFGRPIGTRAEPINYEFSPAPAHEMAEAPIAEPAGNPGVQPLIGLDLVVQPEWERVVFGTGIGAAGLEVVDLEGDGSPEIVAPASVGGFSSNTYWYILKHQGSQYNIVWTSPILTSSITALRVANVDGDSDLDVVVAFGNQIRAYDGTTRTIISTISTGATSIRGLRTTDVDSDGQLEFVFCDDNELFIHSVATGVQEARIMGYGGADLDVGNVDADPDREIVIGNGSSPGFVLNGISRAVEWTYNAGFGSYVRLGDIDNDGMDELVAGQSWYKITVFDLDLHNPRYDIPTDLDIDAVKLYDVENNGSLEIVYGDGQWGAVYVHAGATGAFKWQVNNPEHGVTDVAVGDSDDDGVNELLWGAGFSSTGEDHLYVASTISTHAVEWQTADFSGPFYAIDYGDVDNDGVPELLYGCFESDSGYGDGLFFIHDATTYNVEYTSPSPTGSNWTGLWRIRHANVDGDPQHEIIITTSQTYSGIVKCYDGLTHAQQWSQTIQSGQTFRSLDVADVDSDGQLEVVAAVYREHTGASGTYLYVFNASTGSPEWQSISVGSYWAALDFVRVANVDQDNNLEIIVAESGGGLWAFDGVTHVMQTQTADLNITSLDTVDLNGNGNAEIVIGNSSGAVQVIDPLTSAVSATLGNFGGQINGLQIADVLPGGPLELVYALNGVVHIRSIGGAVLWSSENLTSSAGANDSIVVADIDEDGRTEIVVNTGVRGLKVYEVAVDWLADAFEGDMNGDGLVNPGDVESFVLALTDPISYASAYPDVNVNRGDMNQDSLFNGDDIQDFVVAICGP